MGIVGVGGWNLTRAGRECVPRAADAAARIGKDIWLRRRAGPHRRRAARCRARCRFLRPPVVCRRGCRRGPGRRGHLGHPLSRHGAVPRPHPPGPPAGTDRGVTLARGTDHNPGTCGITSMSLVVALAVHGLGLSVGAALAAATRGGAESLRLADRGRVEPGLPADLVLWDADHEGAFAWAYGLAAARVWKGGVEIDG
jgi:hypothetical protein